MKQIKTKNDCHHEPKPQRILPTSAKIGLNQRCFEINYATAFHDMKRIVDGIHAFIAVNDLKTLHLWNFDFEPELLEHFLDAILDLVNPVEGLSEFSFSHKLPIFSPFI